MAGLAIAWAPRREPLAAVAALGLGPVAAALGRLLLERDELRERARVVVGRELLVMLASTELLPWVDGVVYLGEAAPGLYLPTTLAPSVAIELLVGACTARGHATPLALIPAPALIIPLVDARPVDREVLAGWLAGGEA